MSELEAPSADRALAEPVPSPAQAGGAPQDARSDLQTLARGGTLNLVSGVVRGLLGFVLVVVVTRGLHSGGTGVFFESIALFTILINTAQLGADTGLVREVARFRALALTGDLRALLAVSLGPVFAISLIFAIGVFAFADQLAGLMIRGPHQAEGADFLRVLAPFLPVAATSSVALSATRGFGTMLPAVAIENLSKPLVRPLLMLGAVALGLGTTVIGLAWAIPEAVGFPAALAILLMLSRREQRLQGRATARSLTGLAKEFWRFSAPRGLAAFFQIAVIWLDVLLVGALIGAKEAGIYAAASRFAVLGWFAIEAIRLAIAPQMSALLARGDRVRAKRLYQVATSWLMAPSWPLYVGLAVFAPLAMRMFGPGFASGQTALMILSLSMLVGLGTGNVTVVLLMGGKSWWNLLNTVVSLAINVGLNLVLIPKLGISGAAIAWLASLMWDNFVPLLQVALLLKLHPFGNGYVRVALGSLVCYGVVGLACRWLLGLNVFSLIVFGVLASLIYLTLIWRSRSILELPLFADALRRRWRIGRPAATGDGSSGDGRLSSSSSRRAGSASTVVRTAAKRTLRSYGVFTSSLRPLPDFLIIGAKRGGTTSMYNYLLEHPNVAPLFPRRQNIKGVHFFDTNFARGVPWYRSHFPTGPRKALAHAAKGIRPVVGEASPYYLFHPLAPARAAAVVPDARIIVLLRNPADRAYSHYRERVRNGMETLSFQEALEREHARLAGEEDRMLSDPQYHSRAHEHFSYVKQGMYVEPLKRWLDLYPRDRVLVLLAEEFYREPALAYDRVLAFLGLPPHLPAHFRRYNFHPGETPDPLVRETLLLRFASANERLAELAGLDLRGWWNETSTRQPRGACG